MASKHSIKTPHAAVLVWNYEDRVGVPTGGYNDTGVSKNNILKTEKGDALPPVIVSTLSCVSIQTSKSKSQPDGHFQLVLAPFKNWVSTLTTGSWCAILMSNEPIQEKDLKRANKNHIKMFGRIESVRCETTVDDTGARKTLYYVTGTDWGYVFNSILYIDNLIAGPNDPKSQGNSAAVAIRNALFGKSGTPQSFSVAQNLTNILDVMGKNLGGFTASGEEIGRLTKTIYQFSIPAAVRKFFDFRDSRDQYTAATSINKIVTLTTGSLVGPHRYRDFRESVGFIDPFTLQGTHTLWQTLLENSNPALNEMFCEFDWTGNENGLQLRLYNRIKPFSYLGFKPHAGASSKLKSFFQYIKTHNINSLDVISVNAGTNWRDKVNFVEIKPQFQEFAVVANWYKQKSQVFDPNAFEREGFRPLILDTKQFPAGGKSGQPDDGVNWDQLTIWAKMMREWYFGTHRMLNGTMVIHGSTEYIAVGNNIKFDAGLINPTPNINAASHAKNKHQYVLAHVESVSHNFTVGQDGARSYRTTIQFVRGIIVDNENKLVGDGMLDQHASAMSQSDVRNRKNTISTSDIEQDPDPQKIRGT